MEEVVGGMLHFIIRVLAWFLIDIFFQVVCWGIGWATLKIITLGQYPKKHTSEEAVSLVGFVILLLPIIGFTLYIYFNGN